MGGRIDFGFSGNGSAESRDNAFGNGVFKAIGVAESQNGFAEPDFIGIAEFERRKIFVFIGDLKNGDIVIFFPADNFSFVFFIVVRDNCVIGAGVGDNVFAG